MRRIEDADDETDIFDEAEAEDLGNDCVATPTAEVTGDPVSTNVGDYEVVETINAGDVSFPRHGRGLLCDDEEAMAEVSAMAVRTTVNEPESVKTSQAPPGDMKWPHDRFEALTVDGEPEEPFPVQRRGRGRGFYRSNRMRQNHGEMNGDYGDRDGSPMESRRGSRGRRGGGRGWQRRGRGGRGQKTDGGLPYYSEHDDRIILKEPVYSDDDRGSTSPARNKMVDEDTGVFPPFREEVGTRGAFRGQGRGGGPGRSRGGGGPNHNHNEPPFFDQGYSRPPHQGYNRPPPQDDNYYQSDHPHFYDAASAFNTMQHFALRSGQQQGQREVYENYGTEKDQRTTYGTGGRGHPPRGMYDGFSGGGGRGRSRGRGRRGEHMSAFQY